MALKASQTLLMVASCAAPPGVGIGPPFASTPESRHVTPTNGLKRLGIGIAAFGALIIGLFAAVPLLVSADAVRNAVQAEIRDATGFNPVLRGEASLSSFPSSSASFTDIALSAGAEPVLAAERLTARLRFLPLLIGRVEVAEITLIRPQLSIDIDV